MNPENIKRIRAEPKNYNLSRNYTVKRPKPADINFVKKKPYSYGTQMTIFDSGAFSVKFGNSNMDCPMIMPNCIIKAKSERKRPFIGNQIEDCRDLSGLYYLLPCERGYVTKWDVQKPLWDYVFQQQPIEDHAVIMTQPMFNFRSIQECTDEIFFEEYEVPSLLRTNPTDLAYFNYTQNESNDKPCIVVDSGYSFTHIVPYIEGKKYFPSMIRIDVGGKLLTNYMKDIISYRQLHVMEETYVINQVKEDACFVSADLRSDMKIAQQSGSKNTIVRNYVLPDFNNIRRGYIQEPGEALPETAEGCQILRLNNERFTVPELLIHPSNVGMESMGIAEGIVKCIKKCPLKYQSGLAKNIILIGGNASFPGYRDRIYSEVRSMLPSHFQLNVSKPNDPIGYAWQGGKALSKSPVVEKLMVTRQEYEEFGSSITFKRFNDMKATVIEDPPEIEEVPQKISMLANIKSRSIFGKHDVEGEEMEQVPVEPTIREASKTLQNNPLLASNSITNASVTVNNSIIETKKDHNESPVVQNVPQQVPQPQPPPPPEPITVSASKEVSQVENQQQNTLIQLIQLPPNLIPASGAVKLKVREAPTSTSSVGQPVNKGVKRPIDVTNCVTLGDILKAAGATPGTKDIKITAPPGLIRTSSIAGLSQQQIIRMPNPNGGQPVRVRIHHYPAPQAVIKNITLNNSPRPSTSQGQSILRIPVSSTQTISGQQITILRSDMPRNNIGPNLIQLPTSLTPGSSSQILRVNYTVPKLTAIRPQTQEGSPTVIKEIYPSTSTDKADKTVVLVKQIKKSPQKQMLEVMKKQTKTYKRSHFGRITEIRQPTKNNNTLNGIVKPTDPALIDIMETPIVFEDPIKIHNDPQHPPIELKTVPDLVSATSTEMTELQQVLGESFNTI